MKNRVLTVLIVGMLAVSSYAEAKDLCFSWTKNTDKVDGYKIYRDPTTNNAYIFPSFLQDSACNDPENPTKCRGCVPDIEDGLNHRYAATAFAGNLESGFSAYADVLVQPMATPVPAIEQNPTVPGTFLHVLIPVAGAIPIVEPNRIISGTLPASPPE